MKISTLVILNTIVTIFIVWSNLSAAHQSNQVIIQPNGGGNYSVEAQIDIIWLSTQETDSITDTVTIEYTINDGDTWDTIFSEIPSPKALITKDTMIYTWTIPSSIQNTSEKCKIRLRNETTDSTYESDDFFSIIAGQYIALSHPNQNNIVLKPGELLQIQWGLAGSPKIERVTIEMSIDSGGTWIVIAYNISSQSPYSIYIPNNETINGLIKISDAENPDNVVTSDFHFSIINTIIPIKNNNNKSNLLSNPSIKPDIISQTLDITFVMQKKQHVTMGLFSLNGTHIRTVTYGTLDKGSHCFQYNYGDVISGCFLVRLHIGEKVFVKNIVHAK